MAQSVAADELDMVLNIGRLREGDFAYVYNDIRAVATHARALRATLKVSLLLAASEAVSLYTTQLS
jgi:deoxyribose-phosphate aldolase